MQDIEDFIARLNVNRFLKLIEHEPDVAQRQLLEELLAAEKAKLQDDESGSTLIDLEKRRQPQDAPPARAAERRVDDPKATTALGPIREASPAATYNPSLSTPIHAPPPVREDARRWPDTGQSASCPPLGFGGQPPGVIRYFGTGGRIA